MAVELTATDYSGTGTGASATYGTGIYANASDQIKVYVAGVLQTLGVNYSINGLGSAAGIDVIGTFTNGAAVYIERVTPITQLVDTQNNETILEDVLDAEFDKLTMIAQEAGGKLLRALLVPKGEIAAQLPALAARANKFAAFDALGALVGAAVSPGVSATGTLVANTRIVLASLAIPAAGQNAWLSESGRSGMFEWRLGDYTARVASDPYQGIYVPSTVPGSGAAVGCWVRIWDEQNGRPEWFGVVANSSGDAANNDLRIAACYALVPHTRFGPFDYWTTTTIKANINHHKISGCGEKYNDVFGAMTRIVCTSGSVTILQMGPDAFPGSINAMPQGIQVSDIFLARSVAPVIASNCVGLMQQFILNGIARNVKTDGCMIGIEANGVVHTFQINCEGVRAVAGTGGGTDYFIGNYANGNGSIGAAGGNASLYVVDCTAGCNYGPLQSATGSIGFKADAGFTDVWYWNPETTNFYTAQAVFGNDAAGLVFSNTDFAIFHPVHDQFKNSGLYVTDVAAAGSVEIENPYFGPTNGARACYWVNSAEGAVVTRGGQYVVGGAPATAAMLLMSSRGCDVLGYPQILEHGNTWPIIGISDCNDVRLEAFAKNPNNSAAAFVQISGTCVNITGAIKSSGKASAFQYGYQLLGTNIRRCTFDVSGLNSANFPAVNRQLNNNGTPIVAAGVFATDCLGQGNFA